LVRAVECCSSDKREKSVFVGQFGQDGRVLQRREKCECL
jgi:hypothetical protein